MKKRLTVTIGIPAYNEVQNLESMVNSILKQKQKYCQIQKILIICDGPNDGTDRLVRKLSGENKLINYILHYDRKGKPTRLNEIYKNNKSDILVTFDADIILFNESVIDNLVKGFIKNKSLLVAGAHIIPSKATNQFERIYNNHQRLWDQIRASINHGNHINNLTGSATAILGSYVKDFRYPKDMICDQGYLYIKTFKKNKDAFRLVKNAIVVFKTYNSFYDLRLLTGRSTFAEKKVLEKYFGNEVYDFYRIPFRLKIYSILNRFIHDPFLTPISICLLLLSRKFPIYDDQTKKGLWMQIISSKRRLEFAEFEFNIFPS